MTRRFSANLALLLLVLLTAGVFVAFEIRPLGLAGGLMIAAVAVAKVRIIIGSYMHLGHDHSPFHQVLLAWCLLVTMILGAGLVLIPWST